LRARTIWELQRLLREKILEEEEKTHVDVTRREKIIESFRKVFGDGIRILSPDAKAKTCYACGGTLFWISKHNGYLYCAVCHPLADISLATGWRDTALGTNWVDRTVQNRFGKT